MNQTKFLRTRVKVLREPHESFCVLGDLLFLLCQPMRKVQRNNRSQSEFHAGSRSRRNRREPLSPTQAAELR